MYIRFMYSQVLKFIKRWRLYRLEGTQQLDGNIARNVFKNNTVKNEGRTDTWENWGRRNARRNNLRDKRETNFRAILLWPIFAPVINTCESTRAMCIDCYTMWSKVKITSISRTVCEWKRNLLIRKRNCRW